MHNYYINAVLIIWVIVKYIFIYTHHVLIVWGPNKMEEILQTDLGAFMHFVKWEILTLIHISLTFVTGSPNWPQVIIVSGNDLTPARRQAITWNNYDYVLWHYIWRQIQIQIQIHQAKIGATPPRYSYAVHIIHIIIFIHVTIYYPTGPIWCHDICTVITQVIGGYIYISCPGYTHIVVLTLWGLNKMANIL